MTARRSKGFPAVVIVIVLIVALLGSAWLRSIVIGQRRALDAARGQQTTSQANLSKLNSFALGLLLGGLKGPLVMALWTSSETQKNDKDLDDFDTKVDLIRLLQPEFDTVHLFQIWNKAYNISVQMANLPNKYTTILDALEYAFSVDRERPGNINIISAIGGIYFEKLGSSNEKVYFSPRLRDESRTDVDHYRVTFPATKRAEVLREARLAGASTWTLIARELPDKPDTLTISLRKDAGDALKQRLTDPAVEFVERESQKIAREKSAGRRLEHETLLDDTGNILPRFLHPREGGEPTYTDADGSALPYLKQFEPYPLGVSPLALGYNYFKRAQWLQENRGARHAQTSDRVVSSRPALALKKWSEEDWFDGRRGEIVLLNGTPPRDDEKLESIAADLPLTTVIPPSPLREQTIYRYETSARIADAAVAEYHHHLALFPSDFTTYASHVESSQAQAQLVRGDAAYLKLLQADPADRSDLIAQAIDHYQKAANLFTRHIFRFYMADELVPDVLPRDQRGLTRVDVENPARLRDEELPLALFKLRARHLQASQGAIGNEEEFDEYFAMIARAQKRLQYLRAAK